MLASLLYLLPGIALLKLAFAAHLLALQFAIAECSAAPEHRRTPIPLVVAISGIATIATFLGTLPHAFAIAFHQALWGTEVTWALALLAYGLGRLTPPKAPLLSLRRVSSFLGAFLALGCACWLDGLGGALSPLANIPIAIPEPAAALRFFGIVLSTLVIASLWKGWRTAGLRLTWLPPLVLLTAIAAALFLASPLATGFDSKLPTANRILSAVGLSFCVFGIGLSAFAHLSNTNRLKPSSCAPLLALAALLGLLGPLSPSLLRIPLASLEGFYAHGYEITNTRIHRRAPFLPPSPTPTRLGEQLFQRQCSFCHAQSPSLGIRARVGRWERARTAQSLEQLRIADEPSSAYFQQMPPLLGNDEETQDLLRFLMNDAPRVHP